MESVKNYFSKFVRRFSRKGPRVFIAAGLLLVLIILIGIGLYLNAAPNTFPAGTVFTIPNGTSIKNVSVELSNKGFISSPVLFRRLVVLSGRQKGVIAGDYYFPQKLSMLSVVRRITHGTFGIETSRITIPEGFTAVEIADLFQDAKFYKFDRNEFLALTADKEGYLFPDTYFFLFSATAADVVKTLLNNFSAKIETLSGEFASSTRKETDIINVASIVEKEAASSTDREIIAGIIWERLKIGMPLQIDATLGYVLNKGTFQLTVDDLNSETPYNTYEYKGLPPTPIGNPGLGSIEAVLHASTTKYLYYLSDKSGTIHYAKTFEEHKRNRELYLGK